MNGLNRGLNEDHRSWSYRPPSGCRHCGVGEYIHVSMYAEGVGYHQWVPPKQGQILDRMRSRRAYRRHLAGAG